PVVKRHVTPILIDGIACLGLVKDQGSTLAWLASGQSPGSVRHAFGPRLQKLDGTTRALRARLAPNVDERPATPEPDLLGERRVLVAIRRRERSSAVVDWLTYHQAEHQVEAALILDLTPGGDPAFCDDLAVNCSVLVVTTGASKVDKQAPMGILDLLRHRFLSAVQGVAFLNISDLLLPSAAGERLFERAAREPGYAIALRGVETFPWRLRQGRPAAHSDHIASRRGERRALRSWAIAPGAHVARAFWRAGAPFGVPMCKGASVPFVRAMGVADPGVPVNRLVRKSDLREAPDILALMQRAFDADPIRLPAPGNIPPRRETNRVTVVTAMKNEGAFILDWVAHNRAIGVSNMLVYTNDCSDGSEDLLSHLAEAGVTRCDNPYRATGKVPQHAAFRAAEKEPVVQEADWLMTLDVDEYLNIHAGDGTLAALFDAVPRAHAISIPWRLFGNADLHDFEAVPVAEQFTRCAPEYTPRPLQAWAFKTLYRNEGLFRRLGVHRPKGLENSFRDALVWVDATGEVLPPSTWDTAWRMTKAQWGYTHATVNHYAVRSAESFLVKQQRGKVNRTQRDQGLPYWFRMNLNATKDQSIQRIAARARSERAKLLSLPGVAKAHEGAIAWHRTQIATLLKDREYAELYRAITSDRQQRLSRIATNFGAAVHMQGPDVIPDEVAARDPSVPFYWSVDLKRAR
ncbi:MAG: glycosyltransferase family 2 protein, partial [Pseudomonadota bacterium]